MNEQIAIVLFSSMAAVVAILLAAVILLVRWNRQLYDENREITAKGIETMQKAISSFYALQEQIQSDGFAVMGKLNDNHDSLEKKMREMSEAILSHLQYLRDHIKPER